MVVLKRWERGNERILYVCQDFLRAKVAATEFCRLVEHDAKAAIPLTSDNLKPELLPL